MAIAVVKQCDIAKEFELSERAISKIIEKSKSEKQTILKKRGRKMNLFMLVSGFYNAMYLKTIKNRCSYQLLSYVRTMATGCAPEQCVVMSTNVEYVAIVLSQTIS